VEGSYAKMTGVQSTYLAANASAAAGNLTNGLNSTDLTKLGAATNYTSRALPSNDPLNARRRRLGDGAGAACSGVVSTSGVLPVSTVDLVIDVPYAGESNSTEGTAFVERVRRRIAMILGNSTLAAEYFSSFIESYANCTGLPARLGLIGAVSPPAYTPRVHVAPPRLAQDEGLSGGQIAGIAIGVVAAVLLCCCCCMAYCCLGGGGRYHRCQQEYTVAVTVVEAAAGAKVGSQVSVRACPHVSLKVLHERVAAALGVPVASIRLHIGSVALPAGSAEKAASAGVRAGVGLTTSIAVAGAGGAAAGSFAQTNPMGAGKAAAGKKQAAAAHKCNAQFTVLTSWTEAIADKVAADGVTPVPAPYAARATVCPHVSLRAMALAAAKAVGAVPATASKDDTSIQFYVSVDGGERIYTHDAAGSRSVTECGITAAKAAAGTLRVDVCAAPAPPPVEPAAAPAEFAPTAVADTEAQP
jgi:hypothetical protein